MLTGTRVLVWLMWVAVTLFSMYKFATQTSYAVVNASIAESMALTLPQIGTLGALYTFAFAAVTVPSGALLDRYGARAVLALAAASVCAGAALFGTAGGWGTLVLGQLLMGAGGAFGFPGAGYVIRHWFPIGVFGLLFGLTQSLVTLSSAVTQGALGYLVVHTDWRTILFYLAAVGAALAVLLALVVRDPEQVVAKSRADSGSFWVGFGRSLREILLNRVVWSAAIPGAMAFAVLLSVAVLWGIRILVSREFDETTASTINAISWIGFAVGAPVIALVASRLNSCRKPFIGSIAGLLLATGVLLWHPHLSAPLAYTVFFLIGFFGGVCMLSFTVTTQVCRDVIAGTAIAVVNMIMFALSGFMMSLPAWLAGGDDVGAAVLEQGLLILPIGLLIALICSFGMKDPYQPAGV
jgi:sugar phosphate permease